MGSIPAEKPHAVCVPYPAQGHITPMLKLAKLLHSHGFHVTFVNTLFNHKRLIRSRAISALHALPSFRFASIPDGLPPSDEDATQDIPSLCEAIPRTALPPFRHVLRQLNEESPPVSCIVSDGVMTFTLDAAQELGVPEVVFWTTSACGFMGYLHYQHLRERGLTPLKGESVGVLRIYLNKTGRHRCSSASFDSLQTKATSRVDIWTCRWTGYRASTT